MTLSQFCPLLVVAVSAAMAQAADARTPEIPAPAITTPDSSVAAPRRVLVADVLIAGEDTIRARIRRPDPAFFPGKYPVAIMVVGIETGKDVVDMIEGPESLVVFGMDYPYKGDFDFSGLGAFDNAFELRSMAFATVTGISRAVTWLLAQPWTDPGDITLIAVSFGVFTGVPAAVLDRRIGRLAVVQAGGGLGDVIELNAERLVSGMPPWLTRFAGATMFGWFEPNDHIAGLAPRPLVLITGESDRYFPESSFTSFYEAAGEPKEWIRHKGGHVMPGEKELILELTGILAEHLYGETPGSTGKEDRK
jgi:hypothetical protein